MVKRIALFFLLSVLLAGSAVAQSPCSAPPQSQLYYWGSPNIQIDDRADHVGQFIIEGFAFWAWGPLPPGNTFFKTLAQNNTGPTLSMPMRTTSDHPELGQPAMIYVWTGNYVPAPGSTGVVVQIIEDAECVTEQTD